MIIREKVAIVTVWDIVSKLFCVGIEGSNEMDRSSMFLLFRLKRLL